MEKLEYFTVTPNLKQIYGKTVTKDTTFEEHTEDGSVTQKMENLVLTTTIHRENEQGEYKIVEDSTLKVTMPEGTKILWSEKDGFFIPSQPVCTLEELVEDIKSIKDIYEEGNNDTKGNEN